MITDNLIFINFLVLPVSVKRLGLMDRANGKSRPVLVVLESVEDKHRVMKAKANLKEVASNIIYYI